MGGRGGTAGHSRRPARPQARGEYLEVVASVVHRLAVSAVRGMLERGGIQASSSGGEGLTGLGTQKEGDLIIGILSTSSDGVGIALCYPCVNG